MPWHCIGMSCYITGSLVLLSPRYATTCENLCWLKRQGSTTTPPRQVTNVRQHKHLSPNKQHVLIGYKNIINWKVHYGTHILSTTATGRAPAMYSKQPRENRKAEQRQQVKEKGQQDRTSRHLRKVNGTDIQKHQFGSDHQKHNRI